MLLQLVLGVLAAMLAVMICAWAFGLWRRNGGWTDVFWTWGTGATLAAAALCSQDAVSPPERRWLVAGFMVVWALRLGLYLTPRVAAHAEDPRYAAFRQGGDVGAKGWGGVSWVRRYPAAGRARVTRV